MLEARADAPPAAVPPAAPADATPFLPKAPTNTQVISPNASRTDPDAPAAPPAAVPPAAPADATAGCSCFLLVYLMLMPMLLMLMPIVTDADATDADAVPIAPSHIPVINKSDDATDADAGAPPADAEAFTITADGAGASYPPRCCSSCCSC